MTHSQWETLKWIGNICLLLSTVMMISPHVASSSITPWALFMIGNVIWLADSMHIKSWPWIWIALFLASWDAIIIISRLTGVQLFGILDILTPILNTIP